MTRFSWGVLAPAFLYILCSGATASLVLSPVHAQKVPPPHKVVGDSRFTGDLPNFAMVEPGIYRGAAPTAEGLRKLKAMGVRTIIDLRIEKKGQAEEAAASQALGLMRVRIPMGREAPTKKQTAQFLTLLKNATPQNPVFIHCHYGADRTGAMVGIWRRTHDNWPFDRTYAEMRKYGFKPFLTELKGAVASCDAPAH